MGAVGVVLVLSVTLVPSLKNMGEGAKQSVAMRNVEGLNSAVQQYDQAGGMMTAQVTVPAGVASIRNKNNLPEMQVLSLLRDASKTSGTLVSGWQEPIFSDKGFRAVWVNSLSPSDALKNTLTVSGLRNEEAEKLMASGGGGRFEVIAPEAEPGRMGIVGFAEGGLFDLSVRAVDAARGTDLDGATIAGAGTLPPGATTLSVAQSPAGFDFIGWYSDSGSSFSMLSSDAEFDFDLQGDTRMAAMFAPPITVELAASPLTVRRGQAVNTTAKVNLSNWVPLIYEYSGDVSRLSNSGDQSFTFTTIGEKTIDLLVKDPRGRQTEGSVKISVVNGIPTLVIAPVVATQGIPVTISATGADVDGDTLQYRFKIGTGEWTVWSANPAITHTFNTIATVAISSQVTDGLDIVGASAQVDVIAPMRTLTVIANPPAMGTTTGSGEYPEGSTAVASANANWGFYFKYWSGSAAPQLAPPPEPDYSKDAWLAAGKPGYIYPIPTAGPWPWNAEHAYNLWVASSKDIAAKTARAAWISSMTVGESAIPVAMDTDQTLTANFERRSFAVSYSLVANIGGGLENAYLGLWAQTRGHVWDASGKVLSSTAVTDTVMSGAVDARGTYTIYVPYGDTVTYGVGWSVHSSHVSTGGQTVDGRSLAGSAEWGYWAVAGADAVVGTKTITGDVQLFNYAIGTPLVIDLSMDGKPDLLSGGDWKHSENRRPVGDPSVYREVDLDGSGLKPWEWVGPTDGLLVSLSGLEGTPTATHLFGKKTFGKDWKHGFEPLKTLDSDGNGVVSGSELSTLGIWVDGDSDGKAQPGEIRPIVDHGISSISVTYETDKLGNVSNTSGVTTSKGPMAVWDWISYSYPEFKDSNMIGKFEWHNEKPDPSAFSITLPPEVEPLEMANGGTLKVYKIDGAYYVRTQTEHQGKKMDNIFPATMNSEGILQWGVPGVTNLLFPTGEVASGMTTIGNKVGLWTATGSIKL